MFRLPLRVKPTASVQADGCPFSPASDPGSADGADPVGLPRLSNARPHRPADEIGDPPSDPAELAHEADQFLQECYAELALPDLDRRRRAVAASIALTGHYEHTFEELEYGARVAWRNSSKCIGRLYWHSLRIRDRRHVTTPVKIAAECVAHLREATNNGKIRPLITVFAPDRPGAPGPRVHNDQLVRYAGYRRDGETVGDPRNIALTERIRELGWYGHGTAFDVLPLLVEARGFRPYVHILPPDAVAEVPLSHPDQPWFAELGLRWHAVPVISDMCLEIGGLHYRCAPFNGWYMGTEIGSRNLADADRYDLLPAVAAGLGLDTSTERTLWRDRALVELNRAVLHSYEAAGVTVTDHHTESHRFLMHLAKEEEAGRICPADWSWIVPPLSSGSTAVFHRYYDELEARPNFARHTGRW